MASTSAELPSGSSSTSRVATNSAALGAPVSTDAPSSAPADAPLLPPMPSPDYGADRRPQLGPLVIIEIGHAEYLEIAALAHHEHGMDNPDLAAQASQLLDDSIFE
jgi:hypothetical protein